MTNREKLEQMRAALVAKTPDLPAILYVVIGMLLDADDPPLVAEGRPLRPGDVVRLRSGGPEMTVVAEEASPKTAMVRAGWFATGEEYLDQLLPAAALTRVEDARSAERAMLTRVFEALEAAERAAHVSPQALDPVPLRDMLLKAKSELFEHLYG